MDTLDAIQTKRAVREFSPEPVPEETIRKILDGGRLAQSSKNTQPWQYVVVREREHLQALAKCGHYARHLAGAAFAVVIAQSTDWTFDIGQTAAYLQLAAWDLGVSSCLASIYEADCARKILGIPADLGIQIAISFGYAARQPAPPRKGGRRTLDQIVHWERW